MDLHREGVLEKFHVEMIGARAEVRGKIKGSGAFLGYFSGNKGSRPLLPALLPACRPARYQ
jgi:hypothetical protein